MKVGNVVLLLFLVSALSFGIYVLWTYLPGDTVIYQPVVREYHTAAPSVQQSKIQFYPNMRFSNREISYSLDNMCGAQKQEEVYAAFSVLSEKTVLRFYPVTEEAQVEILCSELKPTAEQKTHFVAGEGGPTAIINATKYYVILGGKISLFREETCSTPQVALHELLHALGFDHNQQKESVMYPITDCTQELDSYIVDAINVLYDDPAYPDLALEEVHAMKSGRYLAFEVTIANIGLKDAHDVRLAVLVDDVLVKEFTLYTVSIGTRKLLTVENFRIPSDTIRISFRVESVSDEPELSTENNNAILEVQEQSTG